MSGEKTRSVTDYSKPTYPRQSRRCDSEKDQSALHIPQSHPPEKPAGSSFLRNYFGESALYRVDGRTDVTPGLHEWANKIFLPDRKR